MNIMQSIMEALESLSSNKLRSTLTMLGIVIGVASVIAMLGIGSGTEAAITEQIEGIGTNLLYVSSGGESNHPEALTMDDAASIADPKFASSVSYVAPVLQGQVEVSVPGSSTNTSLTGVTTEFFEVQNADVAEGLQISEENLDEMASVVLLGTDVADDLFERTTDLVGETVRVNGQIFSVIGVLEEQGGSGFGSSDDRVLVPLTTAQIRLIKRDTADQVDLIYVQASSSETVESAIEEVSQILRSQHLSTIGEDDFEITSTQAFLDTASTITGTMTIFLGGIAGVSLLVGGIGIMNIMFVSVIERTKEIGLRKAMGARKLDILLQFLVESSLLSLGGGMIGILVGWGIAVLIGQIASFGGNPIDPIIQVNTVLLATLFSASVGLFFGLYPANRASNLEPVEALRTE
jgi:putative ABC transport system permease protein